MDVRGHSSAHLHYTLDLDGPTGGEGDTIRANLLIDVYYALDLHRQLRVTLAGPITAHNKASSVEIDSTGTLAGDETYEWLKIAGVKVAAPPPAKVK